MAQEARNTEFQGSGWRSQGQLRKVPVNFVKSDYLGNVEQERADEEHHISPALPKQAKDDARAENEALQSTAFEFPSVLAAPSPGNQSEPTEALTDRTVYKAARSLGSDDSGRPLDSKAKSSIRPGAYNDSSSQTSSDSEEFVLFNGRGRQTRQMPGKIRKASLAAPGIRDSPSAVAQDSEKAHTKPSSIAEPDAVRYTPRYRERITRRERSLREEEEEDARLQDYMDNMDMASEDEGEGEERPNETTDRTQEATEGSELSWDSDDLRDFDDLNTTDDEAPPEIKRILSRRTRESGLQYLVCATSQSVDDAKWMPHSRLRHAEALIQSFDAKLAERAAEAATLESPEDDTSEADEDITDLLNEMESEDDEREATEKRVSRMTDHQIARALERQEAFGLPTDTILLFDDAASETGQSDDDLSLEDEEDELFRRHRNHSRRPTVKSTRKDRRSDGFPSASAFADALDQDPHGAFDVMDFERPSLKPKSKGRRGKLDLGDLEDEELEAQLQQSWENDRQKKKVKKQERQELREQGRLGQKQGRIDMKAKYPNGMKNHQVKAELKGFLLAPKESMAFPPMHASLRAYLHMLAAKAGVTSKSQGSGNDRFTILTKKKATPAFDTLLAEDVDLLLSARKAGKGKGKGRPQHSNSAIPRHRGFGGVKSGAFYRDGEIVGAAAPELGTENRGRAMLEKMGWTSGTALGAVDNKGILQPVAHIVKNSKTGLG
ncbi:MAG: hypothetical protein Q9160_003125 [Pyrenula sp. 1 TL-2023]